MSYLERLEGTGCRCQGLPERIAHLSVPIGYVVGNLRFPYLNASRLYAPSAQDPSLSPGECSGYCDDAHFGKVCGLAQHRRGTRGKRDKDNKKYTRRK